MLRRFRRLVLYTCLALGANAAHAGAVDISALEALRAGSMAKLAFHDAPRAVPEAVLEATEGSASMADYRGKWVVLNFWATWCPPCREEMPGLDSLQGEMGGDDLAVVTVAAGRNAPAAIDRFFAEAGIAHLPRLRDPSATFSRAMGVLGLPVTVILNPEGQEVARLVGEADWNSDSARAILAALIAAEGTPRP